MGMNRTMCASYINYITGRMQFTFKRWTRSAAFIFSISQPPSRTCITTNRQQPKPKQNQMKLYQTEKNWTTKTEYIQIKQQPKREKVPTGRKSDWWRSSVIANRISVSSISAYFVSASRKRNRYGRKDIGTETKRQRDRETMRKIGKVYYPLFALPGNGGGADDENAVFDGDTADDLRQFLAHAPHVPALRRATRLLHKHPLHIFYQYDRRLQYFRHLRPSRVRQ